MKEWIIYRWYEKEHKWRNTLVTLFAFSSQHAENRASTILECPTWKLIAFKHNQ